MQTNKSNLCVTEVVGTLLLLMISISIFSVLNFYVLTFDSPSQPLSANIIGYVDGNDLILEHHGGAHLRLNETSIILSIDDIRYELDTKVDFTLTNPNTNGDSESWEISEILIYTHDFALNNNNVYVSIIDQVDNSIVMTGNLNKEDEINNQPTTPVLPEGSGSGDTGVSYSYSTVATDPDGDVIKYGWDWDGDDIVDEWTSFYASGSTVSTSHSWGSANTYNVKVKAMDINNGQSGFSTSLTVVISGAINTPPHAPTNPTPLNSATGIGISPSLSVDVSDPDSDTMDVTFYNASDDSIIGTDSGVASGGTAITTWTGLSYSTVYSWYAVADDGTDTTQSATWSFTTEGESSWVLLTYDDFEAGSMFSYSNYTDGGGDCDIYTSGTNAHQGSNAAVIRDNSNDDSSFYHTNSIDVDTLGYTSIKVDFWYMTDGFGSFHDFFLEYWDGSIWRKPATFLYDADFINNQFYHRVVWINESVYTFPSDMKIKFRCDANNNNNEVYIDEIYVYVR